MGPGWANDMDKAFDGIMKLAVVGAVAIVAACLTVVAIGGVLLYRWLF